MGAFLGILNCVSAHCGPSWLLGMGLRKPSQLRRPKMGLCVGNTDELLGMGLKISGQYLDWISPSCGGMYLTGPHKRRLRRVHSYGVGLRNNLLTCYVYTLKADSVLLCHSFRKFTRANNALLSS